MAIQVEVPSGAVAAQLSVVAGSAAKIAQAKGVLVGGYAGTRCYIDTAENTPVTPASRLIIFTS